MSQTPPVFHMIADAAKPVAPYSHAVEVGDWVFLTGQLPNDPENDAGPLPSDIESQTQRTLENLRLVLKGLGLDLSHIVSARVFLTHFEEDYVRMNTVYRAFFPANRLPARTCIGVTGLARKARIEIDAIAKRS